VRGLKRRFYATGSGSIEVLPELFLGWPKKMGVVFGKNGGDARGANENQDMD